MLTSSVTGPGRRNEDGHFRLGVGSMCGADIGARPPRTLSIGIQAGANTFRAGSYVVACNLELVSGGG